MTEDECGLGSSFFGLKRFHITVKMCKQRAITVFGLIGVVISFLVNYYYKARFSNLFNFYSICVETGKD